MDFVNEFFCACANGYEGGMCQSDIDECVSLPCQNSGTCLDGIDAYYCDCADGFTGSTCAVDIDECARLVNARYV